MKKRLWILLLALFLIAAGCKKISRVRIGSKVFTEQLILAEMMAQLCEDAGIRVKRIIPYGVGFACADALAEGEIDLYAEYTGTGLVLLGQPAVNAADKAYSMVKEGYGDKIQWLKRFGFSNDFVLLMRKDRAVSLHINAISDLAKLAEHYRWSCEDDFLNRPLDGLTSLLRRYGLKRPQKLVIEDDKSQMYHLLLDGKVDVVVGYSTDGHISDYGLKILKDDLKFFPVYQAAPVVRQQVLKSHPELAATLDKLAGLITTEKMRAMNRLVELEGQNYKDVARSFLSEQKLLPPAQKKLARAPAIKLAVSQLDELSGIAGNVKRAVRRAFPGRPIQLLRVANPTEQLTSSKARLALASADAFFRMPQGKYSVINRSLPAQAFAVAGYKMAHLLVAKDSKYKELGEMSTVGVGPKNAVSHRVTAILLTAFDWQNKIKLVPGKLTQQIAQIASGKLDGLLLMVRPGHSQLVDLLGKHSLQLLPLKKWQEGNYAFRFPFLRPARIAAGIYGRQQAALETISIQIVLAGPTQGKQSIGDIGPATAITSEQGLSNRTILKLAKELGREEKLDPLLPAPQCLHHTNLKATHKINESYNVSALNALVIMAIIYLLVLFFKEES